METGRTMIVDNAQKILTQLQKVIVGKDSVLLWALATILAKGHILLEDIPGVGKTTMAVAFSKALGLSYNRVQFTPDVLPSDITGYSVLNQVTGTMEYRPGAVLCNLCLLYTSRYVEETDIIVPNITEACFMTGTEYRETYDEAYIKELLQKLSKLGAKVSILTGVSFEPGKTGVMGYETATGEYSYYCHEKLPRNYHGTGDIFSSTCVGAMMGGKNWQEAVKVAADYTAECIRLTMADPEGRAYGVNFEQAIPYLLERMK